MDWSLTRPEQGNVVGQSDDFIEEQVKRTWHLPSLKI